LAESRDQGCICNQGAYQTARYLIPEHQGILWCCAPARTSSDTKSPCMAPICNARNSAVNGERKYSTQANADFLASVLSLFIIANI
jgi:hypothetical protein